MAAEAVAAVVAAAVAAAEAEVAAEAAAAAAVAAVAVAAAAVAAVVAAVAAVEGAKLARPAPLPASKSPLCFAFACRQLYSATLGSGPSHSQWWNFSAARFRLIAATMTLS